MKPYVLNVCWMASLFAVCTWPAETHAIPVNQNFSGVQVNVVGEFINTVPVPVDQHEFAPSFQLGQTITGSIAYDTNQPDSDPGPYGTYSIGALSVNIPELGLSASRSSNSMQISVFNNTPEPDDQLFAYVTGVDSFSSNVGLPNPVNFDVTLFGATSMLADDLLPASPIDWTSGSVAFDFLASDNSLRQVLLTFSPVPEPAALGLLLLGGLAVMQRKKA